MKKQIFILLFLSNTMLLVGQQQFIEGSVKGFSMHEVEHDDNKNQEVHQEEQHIHKEPLPGASVYWAGTTIGTATDVNGNFKLKKTNTGNNKLVVSYTGYKNDTLTITNMQSPVNIFLTSGHELNEVIIKEHARGAYISKLKPLKTEVITSEGLTRLACCNLSESFENSATVDVGYADAVSGAKQIKMLGLAGVYSQLLSENIPSIRGLATTYGLNYVPGSWMESIQISKGTASVTNGYESVTGQINIEYKKPENSGPLFLNFYANNYQKAEMNVLTAHDFSNRWKTMLLGHVSYYKNIIDNNNDGFLDMPKNRQVNVYNRWKYDADNGHAQVGVKILDEERKGGQLSRFKGNLEEKEKAYPIDINIRRYQLYGKRGFELDDKGSSLGFMATTSFFDQNADFGNNGYEGKQVSFYSNAILNTFLKNPKHGITSGLSYQYDEYDEQFNDTIFHRTENVPGIFGQYTYSLQDQFTLITGLRFDYNSEFGPLYTPRVHIKWNLTDNAILRSSAGKGYRSANVFAEHIGILASSRQFVFSEEFDIEEAWNYGLNFSQDFAFIGDEPAVFTIDFYRTDFVNQIIVDRDQDFQKVYFYNLDGKSYSNSFQTGLTFEPIERLEINTAYRFNDVVSTYNGEQKQKPFVKKHKGLATFSYSTEKNQWQFDITNQFVGKSRLTFTGNNPVEYRKRDYSPTYYVLHTQVTRVFKNLEVYIGGENLTGYKQNNPIIAANDPFGDYFDTSFVWGPITGRKIYAGLRFTLK